MRWIMTCLIIWNCMTHAYQLGQYTNITVINHSSMTLIFGEPFYSASGNDFVCDPPHISPNINATLLGIITNDNSLVAMLNFSNIPVLLLIPQNLNPTTPVILQTNFFEERVSNQVKNVSLPRDLLVRSAVVEIRDNTNPKKETAIETM